MGISSVHNVHTVERSGTLVSKVERCMVSDIGPPEGNVRGRIVITVLGEVMSGGEGTPKGVLAGDRVGFRFVVADGTSNGTSVGTSVHLVEITESCNC